jgi:hypothetical protein
LVLVPIAAIILIGVVVTWFMTSDGRAWRAKQRERRKQRRRKRSLRY